ncbi:16182_t:CDS:2 [Gigaspora rosea]|nr:16182_t:CDS:2 [Gigaspora rosea]
MGSGVQTLKDLNRYVKSAKATISLDTALMSYADYVRKLDTTNETVYHLNVPNVDVKDTITLNVENNATSLENIISTLLYATNRRPKETSRNNSRNKTKRKRIGKTSKEECMTKDKAFSVLEKKNMELKSAGSGYDMNIDMIFRIAKVLLKQTTLTINEALRERQEDKYSLDYEDENNYYPDESGYYHLEHIEETENREFTDLAEALERSLETFTE